MKYNVIAIEREYASGGQEIGRRTAEALGIPCYGREILEIAAQRGGRSPEYLEQLEETATNSLLYSFYRISQQSAQGNMLSNEDALYLAEWKIIQELADQGPAVFVGRCASYVLKRRKDLLSVFVRAGVDFRVERAVREYGVERERAVRRKGNPALHRVDRAGRNPSVAVHQQGDRRRTDVRQPLFAGRGRGVGGRGDHREPRLQHVRLRGALPGGGVRLERGGRLAAPAFAPVLSRRPAARQQACQKQGAERPCGQSFHTSSSLRPLSAGRIFVFLSMPNSARRPPGSFWHA